MVNSLGASSSLPSGASSSAPNSISPPIGGQLKDDLIRI
jgi:hypothetical protein